MSTAKVEAFLAKLYSDEILIKSFFSNAEKTLEQMDLTEEEKHALLSIDRIGLRMAFNSYARKRTRHKKISLFKKTLHNFLSLLKRMNRSA